MSELPPLAHEALGISKDIEIHAEMMLNSDPALISILEMQENPQGALKGLYIEIITAFASAALDSSHRKHQYRIDVIGHLSRAYLSMLELLDSRNGA